MLSGHQFKYSELNKYKHTAHFELFSPENVGHWSIMHDVQRTFLKENKTFWRETARANIERIRFHQQQIKTLEKYINEQDCPPVPHQIKLKADYQDAIKVHMAALNIALKRRQTGFAIHHTLEREAKAMMIFFTRLRMLNLRQENSEYFGNIIEEALGIFQKEVFYETPHECSLGLNNEPLLKRIVAYINCDRYDTGFTGILNVQVVVEEISERLSHLNKRAKTSYKIPTYQIRHNRLEKAHA